MEYALQVSVPELKSGFSPDTSTRDNPKFPANPAMAATNNRRTMALHIAGRVSPVMP